jgi:ATP phosphoribosyltransferase regulatory subunit
VTHAAARDTSCSSRLAALLAHFARAGFVRREPALLQPAGVFLDRLGEDLRGRLYLTSDARGSDLCLRPEFTIPVSLDYLVSADAGRPAAIAYGGPIFRSGADSGPGEFAQAGVESFGRDDREAADAEILAVALEAAKDAGAARLDVTIGDAGLVSTFLDRLALPPVWRRRLAAGHARGQSLAKIFSAPQRKDESEQAGVYAALQKVDPKDAQKLVEDLLSIAGISTVGGRGAAEIAERFLEQATLNQGALSHEKRDLVESFFAIEGTPDVASAALRRLASSAQIDLEFALDAFDTRASFIAARGLALDDMTFSASFARRLDYYSGFVFEARAPQSRRDAPVIGGGRYDRLLRTLGAKADIPAVGAAIWVDRLAAAPASAPVKVVS